MGMLACFAAFTSFTAGSAENLATCLASIDAKSACDAAPVAACLKQTYAESCVSPPVENACKNFGTVYCTGNETLDLIACGARMKPFSTAALVAVSNCMQASQAGTPCQTSFDACVEQQTGGY